MLLTRFRMYGRGGKALHDPRFSCGKLAGPVGYGQTLEGGDYAPQERNQMKTPIDRCRKRRIGRMAKKLMRREFNDGETHFEPKSLAPQMLFKMRLPGT